MNPIFKLLKFIIRLRGVSASKDRDFVNRPPVFTVANKRTIKNKTHEYHNSDTQENTKSKTINFELETDFAFGYGTMSLLESGFYILDEDQTIQSIKWEHHETETATKHYPILHLTDGTHITRHGKLRPEKET